MAVSELQAERRLLVLPEAPDAVAKIVARPGVFICNECVGL